MTTPRILAFAGSLRTASFNRKLIQIGVDGAKAAGADVTLIDLRDFAIPVYDGDLEASGLPEGVLKLKTLFVEHHGLLISSPEYNGSIPGPLKNAIDWVSRMKDQPFKDKPVALQSVAGGPLGGGRVQYQWRQIMVFVEALVFLRPEVFVGMAGQKFDEKTLEFKDEAGINFIKQQLAGFEKFIRKVGGKA